MPRHVVAQGESLAAIARKLGFDDAKPIREHPANARLWERGRAPHLLLAGDVLEIPAKREKKVPRKTGAEHPFTLKKVEGRLRLVLEDQDGKALADEPFTLRIQASRELRDDQGLEIKKRTTTEGLIDEPLPPGAVKASLVLDDKPWLTWALQIGHLDPLSDPTEQNEKKAIASGVQGRLNNLGFHCGKIDGVLGPKTEAALARFQRVKMERAPDAANGKLDDETLQALLEKHGV